ncbi:hypothetical protein CYMTET_42405, partial [Cymbomonas tetramitiformis]
MLEQSFWGASGHVSFDDAGERAGTVQYEVLNHAGESQLQRVALWSADLNYAECVAGCHPVVWSTGHATPPTHTRSYRVGIALDLSSLYGVRVSAILMALADIARDPSMLLGTALLFMLEHSNCNAADGREAARRLYAKGADVVIGTSCSSGSRGAQELLELFQIPQISGSATSASLSTDGTTEVDAYPYFMRTTPSDRHQAIAMADMVLYYNWSRVATVAVEDDYGLPGIGAFHSAAEERGIEIPAAHRLTYAYGLQNFSEVVTGLQDSRAYIIVLFGHSADISTLLEQAYAAGVGGEGYVWIGSDGTASSKTWDSMSVELSDEEKNDIMRGYLGLTPYIDTSTPEYMAFAERWAAQPATVDEATGECSDEVDDAGAPIWRRYDVVNGTTYSWCIGTNYADEEISQFSIYDYDATYVMARALQELLGRQEGNVIEHAQLKEAMLQQSFTGASGQIAFDDVGDRTTGVFYEVLNHAGDSQLRHIGSWNAASKFTECAEAALDTADCHPVVWSTGMGMVPKTSHLYVGLLGAMVSEDGERSTNGGALTAGTLLALAAINEDTNILPDTTLLLAMEDGKCSDVGGKRGATVLQSRGSSTSVTLAAEFFFMRTAYSDGDQSRAMADMVHYYNWTRVATVAVDNNYGINGIEEFHNAAKNFGIDILGAHRLTYPDGTKDFSEVVAGLHESRAYIIVMYVWMSDIGRLMEQAYASGVGGEGYVWIVSESGKNLQRIYDSMSSELSIEEKNHILQGYFGMVISVNTSTPECMAYAERWAAQPATVDAQTGKCSEALDDVGSPIWLRPYNDSTQFYCMGADVNASDPFHNIAMMSHDAVFVVSKALHELVEVRGRIEIDGWELMEAMLEQSFTGLTGLLEFKSDGDRTGDVSYEVVRAGKGTSPNTRQVGTWSIASKYEECDQSLQGCDPIDWPTEDGTVPPTSYVNIGVAGGLVGNVSGSMQNLGWGGEHVAAIALAIAEVNRDGLLLPSTKLRFLLQDSKCEADAGRDAAVRLLLADADVVVGTSCTSSSEPAQQELKTSSVPQISGAASSPSLSKYSYFMRTIPSDSYMATAMADMVQYYNWTRVATVAVDNDYGRYGIEEFHHAAAARSIDVVQALTFSSYNTEDLSEVVAGLQRSRANIIVVFAYDVEIGRLMEQAYAAGVGGEGYVWIGSDTQSRMWGEMSSQLSEQQKSDIMRGYLGPVPYTNKSTPEYMAFAERWAAQPATVDEATGECSDEVDDAGAPIWMRYDADNDSSTYDVCVGFNRTDAQADQQAHNAIDRYAPYFYDATMVVARALHQLLLQQTTDNIVGAQLRDSMVEQSFVRATGHISFNEAGDRDGGIQYEVLNHAGDSRLQRVAFHSSSRYSECTDDCHPVVWSSGAERPQDGTCEAGRVFRAEANRCEPCEAGTFHDSQAEDCLPCEPGTVTLDVGAAACLACRDLQATYYQDLTGQASCKDCPLGADCSSGVSAVGLEGYWRDAPERESLYECYPKDFCLGEVAPYQDPGCLEGQSGPLCSVCAAGYVRSQVDPKERCTRCEGGDVGHAFVILLILLIALVCLKALAFLYWPWIQHYRGMVARRTVDGGGDTAALRAAGEVGVLVEATPERGAGRSNMARRSTIRFPDKMEEVRDMFIRNFGWIYELLLTATPLTAIHQYIDSAMKALTEQGFPGYTLGTEIAASLISFSQVLGSFVEMRIDWPKDLERALSQLNINRYLSLDLTGFQCRLPSNFYK